MSSNIYFETAYKKYNETVPDPSLNISPEEVLEYSKKLVDGENFTIMRFNDGEWAFAFDVKKWVEMKIKKNHPDAEIQLKYGGLLLKNILDDQPEYLVSVDSLSLTHLDFKPFVESNLHKFKNRLKGGFFNIWSLTTGFKDIFEIFKTRKVLLVGPEYLSKLPFPKDHIKVDPKQGIYNIQKYVYEVLRYLDKYYCPNMIIVYSCSFIAKVTINEVYKIYGDSLTQLDMGASLNPYVEYNNRPWFDEIIKQLEEENFYRRTKIHPTAYIEEDVEIGENVTIGPFCVVRKGAKIGDDCSFTAYCEIREGVTVGNNTSFGSRCTISAGATVGSSTVIKYGFVLTDTPNLEENDVKVVGSIGDNVLIGANVTLMPGFSIGNNSVIGACSQVRTDVGDNEIWFGSPAKFYKKNER